MNSERLSTIKRDFFASIVVFLVALPLCMGVAIACGAPVAAGLITGIIGGVVVGSMAGCPLQVSGPAAGLIVLVYEIVQRFGIETLGVVVLLAGVLQVVAGLLRWGQWFRAVSPAVIMGMLAGIGVLIFAGQFHVMVDDQPRGSGIENLLTIPQAVAKSLSLDDFQNRELRQFRAQTLRDVGELHRKQEHLHHVVSESNHSSATGLADLTTEQQAVTTQLASMANEWQRLANQTSDSERLQSVHSAAVAAQEYSEFALVALREGDLPRAAELQAQATESIEQLLARLKNHSFAALVGLITVGVIVVWQTWVPRRMRRAPAPLVAVVVGTLVSAFLALPVLYVEAPSNLWEEIHLPSIAAFTAMPWRELLQAAFVVAVVASAETLLCANAVDQMHHGARTKYDQELWSQGIGNILCGCLGALPMTGVIVRSSANIHAGAQSRLSTIFHGAWLLLFVTALAFLLRWIPIASLAAILVVTGYKLVVVQSIRELRKYGWGEVAIYLTTLVTIVVADLLTGVLVGIGLAALKLLYTFSHLNVSMIEAPEDKKAQLQLEGAATFLRLPKLASALERVQPGVELHVDFERLDYIDHACLNLLMTWARQHETTRGKLVLDWEALHAIFRREGKGHRQLREPAAAMKKAPAAEMSVA